MNNTEDSNANSSVAIVPAENPAFDIEEDDEFDKDSNYQNATQSSASESQTQEETSDHSIFEILIHLYSVILTLIGVAISISSAVHMKGSPASTSYSQIFLLLLYSSGIIFLVLILIIIRRYQGKKRSTNDDSIESCVTTSDENLCIARAKHGVSFYMRMGIVIFTIGILILYVIILFEPSEILSRGCNNFVIIKPLLSYYALEVVFVILQSYTMFKHNRVSIKIYQQFVRFCFIHLAAMNIIRWSFGVVQESFVLFERYSPFIDPNATIHNELAHVLYIKSSSGGSHHSPDTSFTLTNISTLINQSDFNQSTHAPPPIIPNKCDTFFAISIRAAEYLAPCIIEYSLVAVSVNLKMLWAVNEEQHEEIPKIEILPSDSVSSLDVLATNDDVLRSNARLTRKIKTSTKCHKANFGLFTGLTLTTLFVVYLIISFTHTQMYEDTLVFTGIMGIFLALTILTFPMIGYALYRISICGVRINEENCVLFLDKLLITFTGICIVIYDLFALISTVDRLATNYSSQTLLMFFIYICNLIQVFLQSGFLNDGLIKRVKTEAEAYKKPARTVLTLLIFINIIFWLNKSFRAKIDEFAIPIHTDYYGYKAWCIISSFFTPLNIFYSFHATVILAEIWHEVYHPLHDEE